MHLKMPSALSVALKYVVKTDNCLMLVESIAEAFCNTLACTKLPFVFKTFVLDIFLSGCFRQSLYLLHCIHNVSIEANSVNPDHTSPVEVT